MNNDNPIRRTVATLKYPHAVVALIALARAVVQALTGNGSFPNPDPALATVTSAVADLDAAQAVVETRARGAVKRAATAARRGRRRGQRFAPPRWSRASFRDRRTCFRGRAVNKSGDTDWCAPVSLMML